MKSKYELFLRRPLGVAVFCYALCLAGIGFIIFGICIWDLNEYELTGAMGAVGCGAITLLAGLFFLFYYYFERVYLKDGIFYYERLFRRSGKLAASDIGKVNIILMSPGMQTFMFYDKLGIRRFDIPTDKKRARKYNVEQILKDYGIPIFIWGNGHKGESI